MSQQHDPWQRTAEALDTTYSSNRMKGTSQGTDYGAAYSRGGRYELSSFQLRIACRSSCTFAIALETSVDRLSKRWGISQEIQTGDRAFDDAYYLSTEQPRVLAVFLRNADTRDTIRALFQLGYTMIKQTGATLVAEWAPFELNERFTPELVTGTVAHLAKLVAQLAAVEPSVLHEWGSLFGV